MVLARAIIIIIMTGMMIDRQVSLDLVRYYLRKREGWTLSRLIPLFMFGRYVDYRLRRISIQ